MHVRLIVCLINCCSIFLYFCFLNCHCPTNFGLNFRSNFSIVTSQWELSCKQKQKNWSKGKAAAQNMVELIEPFQQKYGHLNGIDLICRHISNSTWYTLQLISERKTGKKKPKRLTVIYVIYILQSFRMSPSLESVWEVLSCVPNKDILLTIAAKTESINK